MNEQKDKKMVEAKQQKRGKYKSRSPRYPCISLREAVKNARTLYEKDGRAFVAKEVAVKGWGYNRLHGRSLTILAAMGQYGLIRYQEGKVSITEDAFIIIGAPRNSLERKAALGRCAKLPTIFEELYQNHPDNLPSDEALKWTLKQRGFTDKGAQITISCLRDTNMFVKDELKDYAGGNEVKEEIEEQKELPPMQRISPHKPLKGDFVLSFTLLTGKNATLTISGGTPSRADIDFIKKLLSAYEDNLPKEENKEQLPNENE
jgi:hypothetical protein